MSQLALVSSVPSLSANLSFAAAAHHSAQHSEQCRVSLEPQAGSFVFQPETKSLAFVVGGVLAALAAGFFSRLPSLSLPVVAASESELLDCVIPSGNYSRTCNPPEITYRWLEEHCFLTTRCETFYAGLPHQPASFTYSLSDRWVELVNSNGSLARVPSPTVSFDTIAKDMGRSLRHASSPENLFPVVRDIFAQFTKDLPVGKATDVAFVVDTTNSMKPYIAEVVKNLIKFLEEVNKNRAVGSSRFAVVEYRDRGVLSGFVSRVVVDFTSNLSKVADSIRNLAVAGGDDEEEAVLDALVLAKNELSWREAKKAVLLIGDAPGHSTTVDGRFDKKAVADAYKATGTQIEVYSIVAKTR